MLGVTISGIGKHRDVIRIICGRRKSKFEFIANEEMRTVLDWNRLAVVPADAFFSAETSGRDRLHSVLISAHNESDGS